MGRLKQLLPYRGRTLLQHAIEQARHAGFTPIIVVVGACADLVTAPLAHEPVEIARNDAWQLGMGSSIAAGIRQLIARNPSALPDAAAILLADQPLVTSQYSGSLGVPALFKRCLFPLLEALPPASGARHLLRQPSAPLRAYPLPEAAQDIDTPQDFSSLCGVEHP
jgi:molybdenum cofactor cytidylyltransferase